MLDILADEKECSKIGLVSHEIHQANQVPPDFHWVNRTWWEGFPSAIVVAQFAEWDILPET
jgi:hypothetical protein